MAKDAGWFKMPRLPKPEYFLGVALARRYGMVTLEDTKTDWTELFTIALRLMYEVSRYGSDSDQRGEQWIAQVINDYRKYSEEERVYELLPVDK